MLESPMMSFRSVTNNLGSPRPQQAREDAPTQSQASWRPPPSVIEDSMPDNHFAFAQYCTPTRILEHYASTMSSSPVPQSKRHQTPPASGQPPSTSPGLPPTQEDSVHYLPPHEVPGTAVYSPHQRAGKRRQSASSETSIVVEETRIASSYPTQHDAPAASPRAGSEPPLSKRPRTARDPTPGKPMTRSSSDVGPRSGDANTMEPLPHIEEALEILSPPPLTAHRELRPQDMITDVLARLARELDLEKRFRPESQARDLRPFERGYWLVDCASWEPDLRRSAWGFLSDYLGKGAAGWGTSCRRDAAFSRLRLYCWGCVVGHMYLVLYLMSKRRVLYSGATWVGADGKVVVVMGARPGPA